MSERIVHPEAWMDHYDGVLAVADVPEGDVNSYRRLRECVEDILVPAAEKHAFSVLPRTAVDCDKLRLSEHMYPVKPGANSAQIHIHPYPIEFSCPEGSPTTSIIMDTLSGADAMLRTLEMDHGNWMQSLSRREVGASLFVTETLQHLRKSLANQKGLNVENRLQSAQAAFTLMYLLCTQQISETETELYTFLRQVQRALEDPFEVSWEDYAYGVMDTNVAHARSVLSTDRRDGPGLFVLSRSRPDVKN